MHENAHFYIHLQPLKLHEIRALDFIFLDFIMSKYVSYLKNLL